MSSLDLAALLQPAPGPLPAGRDLDTTMELLELETAAAEPEEAAFKGIETVDTRSWPAVRTKAERLLVESKDLRVAVILARALLHTRGVAGFCDGVTLVGGLVTQFWGNGLYPVLDDGDAVARLNTLRGLWSGPYLAALRDTRLANARGVGDFSVRDVLVARGKDKPRAGAVPPSLAHVQRALEATPEAAAIQAALKEAAQALTTLQAEVQRASGESLDAAPLLSVLSTLADTFPAGGGATASATTELAPAAQTASGGAGVQTVVEYRERELSSRDDVVALLDRICDYYTKYEPSSPIPLLLQRARRLVTMNFLEIIRDLADKGLPQVEAITGKEKS